MNQQREYQFNNSVMSIKLADIVDSMVAGDILNKH